MASERGERRDPVPKGEHNGSARTTPRRVESIRDRSLAESPSNDGGTVLYKLGANSAGLTLFVEDGILCYEYNCFIIQRTQIRATDKLPVGEVKIEVETTPLEARATGPLKVVLRVNDAIIAEGTVPVSAPVGFTANDCLDIGQALGSPVSLDYREKAPFKFNGAIDHVHVKYVPPGGT